MNFLRGLCDRVFGVPAVPPEPPDDYDDPPSSPNFYVPYEQPYQDEEDPYQDENEPSQNEEEPTKSVQVIDEDDDLYFASNLKKGSKSKAKKEKKVKVVKETAKKTMVWDSETGLELLQGLVGFKKKKSGLCTPRGDQVWQETGNLTTLLDHLTEANTQVSIFLRKNPSVDLTVEKLKYKTSAIKIMVDSVVALLPVARDSDDFPKNSEDDDTPLASLQENFLLEFIAETQSSEVNRIFKLYSNLTGIAQTKKQARLKYFKSVSTCLYLLAVEEAKDLILSKDTKKGKKIYTEQLKLARDSQDQLIQSQGEFVQKSNKRSSIDSKDNCENEDSNEENADIPVPRKKAMTSKVIVIDDSDSADDGATEKAYVKIEVIETAKGKPISTSSSSRDKSSGKGKSTSTSSSSSSKSSGTTKKIAAPPQKASSCGTGGKKLVQGKNVPYIQRVSTSGNNSSMSAQFGGFLENRVRKDKVAAQQLCLEIFRDANNKKWVHTNAVSDCLDDLNMEHEDITPDVVQYLNDSDFELLAAVLKVHHRPAFYAAFDRKE